MIDKFGLLDPVTKANLQREEMVSSQVQQAAHVAKGLKDLDRRLNLVFFEERAEARHDVVPGRWHVWLDNDPGKPDKYYPIQSPDGSYREPDWGVVEAMKMADTWSPSYELPDDSIEAEEARLEEKRAKKREELSEEIASNYAAAKRVAGDGGLEKRLWGRGAVDLKKTA